MSATSSYDISTIAGHVETEINRLKAQVELFWDSEWKIYRECGLTGGGAVIELGSGPGFLVEKLLRHLPDAEVTGMEIDPLLVDYARDYLSAQQLDRWSIVQGSIMDTGLEANTYDFAVTRLVLEHLPDPLGAVREVFRILKPGGTAIFVDNDFEMHIMTYPPVSGLRELYDAYCQARFAEGGNPKIGRELPVLLQSGGYEDIRFDIISAHSTLLGDEMFFKSEGIGIPYRLMKDGYLSSKALGEISVGWKRMVEDERHAVIRQLYMAAGRRPLDKEE